MNGAKEHYYQLIDGICALAGIAEPRTMYENCSISVNQIEFTMTHANFVHPDLAVLYVDFGKPPAERRDVVLQRLLETNTYMFCDSDGPAFSFNAESGHVMLMVRVLLPQVTPASVIALMQHLSDYVKSWQSNFFLSDDERAGKKSSGLGSFAARNLRQAFEVKGNQDA